jgi:hypothetical protein
MWGISIVLGVIGIGLTLWEIASRPSAPAPIPPGVPPGAARTQSPAARAAVQQRAQQCGYLAGDWRDAERWVEKYLPPSANLLGSLKLMHGYVPYANWPMSAKRVLCVYMAGPVPPPPVGQQVADAVFPRYGG